MVAWCVKERESVNLFHCFRVVFYRLSRLVRAWPASQARASFSRRLKRAFVLTLRGSCFCCCCFFCCDQPGAGYHVVFFIVARCPLTAFARELVVL